AMAQLPVEPAPAITERDMVLAELGADGNGVWQKMCRSAASTTFLWAHNGTNKNGFVQLLPGGKLVTPWCLGTWKVLPTTPDVLDLSFGSSQHLCHYKDGGFVVEQKRAIRTGRDNLKPGAPKSTGWISPNNNRGHNRA
ncbi:unnamed protein product, partial [Polarella glacialis]